MSILLDEVRAVRTVTQRGGRTVWDLTVVRGVDSATRSLTIDELQKFIDVETHRHDVRLAELEIAKLNATPEPDPIGGWIDLITVAEDALAVTVAFLEDLNLLKSVLASGGER